MIERTCVAQGEDARVLHTRVGSAIDEHLAEVDDRFVAASVRAARTGDLAAIEHLLQTNALPTAGVADLLTRRPDDFVVAEATGLAGTLVAAGGLEVCGANALLRSVTVDPAWRAQGLGAALVRRLISIAEVRGLRGLYLLTTTAERYFPRHGFGRIAREEVPPEIAATLEFRSICPASAIAMVRPLAATAHTGALPGAGAAHIAL